MSIVAPVSTAPLESSTPRLVGRSRSPLPLPWWGERRTGCARYALAAVDQRGRVADVAVVRVMGWTPGTRLHVEEQAGLLVVVADDHGIFQVTSQGHLRLPAPARHWCAITTGDRVLVAADPEHAQLTVYPPAALDAMVSLLHAARLAGGSS